MGGASPPPGLWWVWGGHSLPVSQRRGWELWTLPLMSLIDSSKLIWVFCFVFYLVVFFLPFLLLLSVALAHLLQGGRCERSQELSTNRGQQRCKPAALQRGANRTVVLQLFSKNKTKKNMKNKSKKWHNVYSCELKYYIWAKWAYSCTTRCCCGFNGLLCAHLAWTLQFHSRSLCHVLVWWPWTRWRAKCT